MIGRVSVIVHIHYLGRTNLLVIKKSDSNFEFSTTENVLLSPWRVSLETSLRMF